MTCVARCMCMRTLKVELHTCRHSNYIHNHCLPNHKETNVAKPVKNWISTKFGHFQSYSALNSGLTTQNKELSAGFAESTETIWKT